MKFNRLSFTCGVKVNEDIYASSKRFNGLFKINVENGKIDFINFFPNEKILSDMLHRNAIFINNKIVFVPYAAKGLHIYDLETNTINEKCIDSNRYKGGYVGELINNIIYLVPMFGHGDILAYDVHKDAVEVLIPEYNIEQEEKNDNYFIRICHIGNTLVLPIQKTNRILFVDIEKRTIRKEIISVESIFGCFAGKSRLWILGDNGNSISSMRMDTGEVQEYELSADKTAAPRLFNWIAEYDDNVYVFPAWSDKIYMGDKNHFQALDYTFDATCCDQKIFEPISSDDGIWLLPFGVHDLLKVSKNSVKSISVSDIEEAEWLTNVRNLFFEDNKGKVIREGDILDLSQYIEKVR